MRRLKIGVVGTGVISHIYLKNFIELFNHILQVEAVADVVPDLAKERAQQYGIPTVYTVDELLADPHIELVVNLTPPVAHAPINLRTLAAGKHVYTEKPFALSREEANQVIELAEKTGLLIGSAPDTFLGAGIQTCIKLIDDGWIGQPYAANATIITGNFFDGMHPNFQNFFKFGGDPIMDMGPYYLTALVAMLGPVLRVTGSARKLRKEVTIQNPKSHAYGQTVPVEAPTNVAAALDFHSGVVASLHAAKEGCGYLPRLEVFGTEGNLVVPDPNFFSGPISITFPTMETKDIPFSHPHTDNVRGLGVAEMAYAIQSGRKNRASGHLARHILDVSLGIFEAAESERHIHLQSTVDRPEPVPLGLKYNNFEV